MAEFDIMNEYVEMWEKSYEEGEEIPFEDVDWDNWLEVK